MIGKASPGRLVRTALLAGAASVALSAAGPDALVPFRDVAGAATEVSVAFVVDFGNLGPPVVACVRVPSGDDGYAALAAFTAQQGEATPIYNSSGLLCSIDNLPGNAPNVCGAQVAGGYDYWSYWHGTSGSWVYADTGAFAPVQNGDVEGWRFETAGSSNPSDPHPALTPDFAAICGSVTPTTNTPTSTTVAGASAAPSPSPSGGGTGSPGPRGVTGSGPSPSTTSSGEPSAAHPVPAGSTPSGASGPTATAPSPAPAGSTTGSRPSAESLKAAAVSNRQDAGGGSVPVLIGALVVVALAAGAVLGWRRRQHPQ